MITSDSWWSRQWNIECALCILVPANKSVSDAILSATGRVKSIDGNPNDLWSFWAQALRQLKTLQLEKLSQTMRSKVTIENQSQVVEQFEDDVLPIAGIMSLKSLNINSLMSVIKYKELTHTKIPSEIIRDQFSPGFHNTLKTFAWSGLLFVH